jgi:hypothetical protein
VNTAIDRRVVKLETKLEIIEKLLDQNRGDHQEINRKLDDIAKEVRK